MIETYCGLLGGGKSYKAIRRSAKYLASGGTLATNIEILPEMFAYVADVFHYEVDPKQIVQIENTYDAIRRFHLHTPRGTMAHPTLAIIDEAGIWLNTRDSAHTRELADWLRLSRKDATDVIFIAQAYKDLDVAIRRLSLYYWEMKDLNNVAIPGMKMRISSRFSEQCFYATTGKPVAGTSRTVKKEPRIFTLYRTEQMFREFPRLQAGLLGKSLVKVELSRKRKMIKYLLIGCVVFAVGVGLYSRNVFSRVMGGGTKQVATVTASPTPAAKASPAVEFLRGTDSRTILITDRGTYLLGELGVRGRCVAVTREGAALEQADGRIEWVRPVSGRVLVSGATQVSKPGGIMGMLSPKESN